MVHGTKELRVGVYIDTQETQDTTFLEILQGYQTAIKRLSGDFC